MKHFSFVDGMKKVPGGMMIIPLLLGSLVKTFFPGVLGIGSFTTGLFRDGATALIALLIVATGAQINIKQSGRVLGKTGALLLAKTLVPGLLMILYGFIFGKQGILGISLLAAMIAFINSNGGLWLAIAGQYGTEEDKGAYIASGLNDGPFFTLLFLGLSGLALIPWIYIVAAIIPFLVGILLGNLDQKFANMMKPTGDIVIPFFSFALGAGINLTSLAKGGLSGIFLGLCVAFITGFFGVLAYKIFFKTDNPGMGFAIGTTAGNSIATVGVVVLADASFAQFNGVATAQVAASVLVTALVVPFMTQYLVSKFRKAPKEPVSVDPGTA
jgi:2-keto-3-deoxygluconate permease